MNRFQAFTESLKDLAHAGEMLARVGEELALARKAGQVQHVQRLAALQRFLQGGLLPGKGQGRKAVRALADGMIARGVLRAEQIREQPVTKGQKFSAFVGHLRDRQAAGDFDQVTGLVNVVQNELTTARQVGCSNGYRIKLLALLNVLRGKAFPAKGTPGRAHLKALAVDLIGAGFLKPGYLPHEPMTTAEARAEYGR